MQYKTICRDCEFIWEQAHLMKDDHEPCPKCESKKVESVIEHVNVRAAQDQFWEFENNGLGRYFPQMEDSKTCTASKKNFFRSRNEAMEAAKRRGYNIIEK